MGHRPYRILGKTLLPFLRSRIWTVRGIEHLPVEGGYILAPNHQSWLDSAIVAAALYRRVRQPLKFVAQSAKYSFLGGIPIDPRVRGQVLDAALQVVQSGHPVVIFPEGNSNRDPELRTGKTGVARLALRSGLPVVPVGIKGTHGVRAWAATLWFFSIVRPCHVVIGEPIRFPKTELGEHDADRLQRTTAAIMERISEVSGKPMPGQGPALGRRGVWWIILWRVLRPLFQWRIRIQHKDYLPENGPFIVAGNHASYFDPPSLAAAVFHVTGLQPMFLTKQTIADAFRRLVGQGGLDAFGMLALDNSDKSRVLLPAINHLRRGGVIGIFPEGTRNKPSLNPNWKTEMLKGKTGAVRLHLATGAPIIPVCIRAPKGHGIVEAIVKAFAPWILTRIVFGPPVYFTGPVPSYEHATKADLDRMTKELMLRLAELSGMRYSY